MKYMTTEVLIKIKKLMAMSDSAKEIGNEAEAQAFAAAVQKMLHKHKMDMSEVINFDMTDDNNIEVDVDILSWEASGIGTTQKKCHWLSYLTSAVCKYNGCSCFSVRKCNSVGIIGTAESRSVVSWLLTNLARYGQESVEKAYRTQYYNAKKNDRIYGTTTFTHNMKGYRRSFMQAYVIAIQSRLKEQWEKDQAEASTERGLILLDKEKSAVEEFKIKLDLGKGRPFKSATNLDGHADGYAAGKAASLSKNGIDDRVNPKVIA